jgi:hypothetical protein
VTAPQNNVKLKNQSVWGVVKLEVPAAYSNTITWSSVMKNQRHTRFKSSGTLVNSLARLCQHDARGRMSAYI